LPTFDSHANLAYSTVLTAPVPATSGTALTLAADFSPAPTPPYNILIWPTGAQPTTANAEIARVTGDTAGVLTITRAQEGTSARTVVAGDQVANIISAKVLTDIEAVSPQTILTTTGDLLYASSANTPARLALGTTGLPLVAGATTPGYALLGSAGLVAPTGGASSGSAVDQYERIRVRDAAFGIAGQTYDMMGTGGTGTTPVSQVIYGALVGLIAGDVVTNILMFCTVAAGGTNPTGVYSAICSNTTTRVAVSNNLNTTAFKTVSVYGALPLSSPYTVPTTGAYYLCVLVNGTWGTTQPTLTKSGVANTPISIAGTGGLPWVVNQTGQATISATPTLVGTTVLYWMGWN
jgi:hypothetical protein